MTRRSRQNHFRQSLYLACSILLLPSGELAARSSVNPLQEALMPYSIAAPYGLKPQMSQYFSPPDSASLYGDSKASSTDQLASPPKLITPEPQVRISSGSWLSRIQEVTPGGLLHYLVPLVAIALVMQRLYKQVILFSSARLEQKIDERTLALKQENRRLQEMSHTDPLTGVKNRHFIEEMIAQDLNRVDRSYQAAKQNGDLPTKADMLAFIIDIDHFKPINDTYGHLIGDQVLAQVAQRLNSLFRNYDYVVRWGGEEFLVVARFVDRHQIDKLAEKVRQGIETMEFRLDNQAPFKITASVGAAPYPFSANQPDKIGWQQVVHLADMALYAAKTTSRNTWFSYMGKDSQTLPDNWQLDQDTIHQLADVSSKPLCRHIA